MKARRGAARGRTKRPAAPARRAWTNQRMASALGVSTRRVQVLKAEGMPAPAAGQDEAAWLAAVEAWRQQSQRSAARHGPPSMQGDPQDPKSPAYWTLQYRRARTTRELLALQREKGEVHAIAECDREKTEALAALLQTTQQMLWTLAEECENQPREVILQRGEAIMRRAFDALRTRFAAHAHVHAVDARGSALAGSHPAEPVG